MTEETQGGHLVEEATRGGRGWRMDGHAGHFPIPGVPFGFVTFTNTDDLGAVIEVAKQLGELAAEKLPEYYGADRTISQGTNTQGGASNAPERRSEAVNSGPAGDIPLYSTLPDDLEPIIQLVQGTGGQQVPGCPRHVFEGNKYNPMKEASDRLDTLYWLKGRLFRGQPLNEPAYVCTRTMTKDEAGKPLTFCPEAIPLRLVEVPVEDRF